MTLADTDDAGQHLTTKDGWRRFVAGGPKSPHIPAPSPKSYAKLPRETRLKLDDLRIDHHARLLVVATSTVRHTVTTGRRLVMLNRHAISVRRGLIVSGPAGTGKTSRSPNSASPTSSTTGTSTPTPTAGSPSSTSPSHPRRPPA